MRRRSHQRTTARPQRPFAGRRSPTPSGRGPRDMTKRKPTTERLRPKTDDAERSAVEAGGAGKPVDDDVPEVVERVAAPAAKNVVPLKPSSAPAAPAYDYDANSDWKSYVNSDGSIRSTPRGGGHDWGPV